MTQHFMGINRNTSRGRISRDGNMGSVGRNEIPTMLLCKYNTSTELVPTLTPIQPMSTLRIPSKYGITAYYSFLLSNNINLAVSFCFDSVLRNQRGDKAI